MRTIIRIEVVPAGTSGWEIVDHTLNRTPPQMVAAYRWQRQAKLVAVFWARRSARYLLPGEAVELVVKGRNGRIRQRNTYGYDPEATRG